LKLATLSLTLASLILIAGSRARAAPAVYQVADLRLGIDSIAVNAATPAEGHSLYLSMLADETGFELWRTDGSAVGTVRVRDINAGPGSSNPLSLAWVAGELYFSANDGAQGTELWSSDGSALGTQLVKDISPGSSSSSPQSMTGVGNVVYFTADTPATGRQLWTSNGTGAGTSMVKAVVDYSSNPSPGSLNRLGVADQTVFFAAAGGGGTGLELWKSDGSEPGTQLVKDINLGPANGLSANPYFAAIGSTMYFVASTPAGAGIWKSGGTEAGTIQVKSMGSSNPRDLTTRGGTLYFDNAQGPWKSDGTDVGTQLIKQIRVSGDSQIQNFTVSDTKLFFTADDGVNGRQLWTSDGTLDGTSIVSNAVPSGLLSVSTQGALGDWFFYVTTSQVSDPNKQRDQLWASDGSAAGTVLLYDPSGLDVTSSSSIRILGVAGDRVYFEAPTTVDANGFNAGVELFAATVPEPGSVAVLAVLLFLTCAASGRNSRGDRNRSCPSRHISAS
jgi:ELWxxDGT repeat protein